MRRIREAGFSVVEGLVVAAVVAIIGVVGYFALNRTSSNTPANSTTPTNSTTATAKDPEAPEITTTSDLTQAQTALDSSELDAADTELNAELNGF